MKSPTPELLRRLSPINSLPPERLTELASFCFIEAVEGDSDPFRLRSPSDQSVYVVAGGVELTYDDGQRDTVLFDTEQSSRPVAKGRVLRSARALGPTELLRIDDDLLDIMVTWDQIAAITPLSNGVAGEAPTAERPWNMATWTELPAVFSVDTLTAGVFASLPPAHIAELLKQFDSLPVKRGEVILREGDAGDFYYVIENGRARVTRLVGGVEMPLADLKAGDAFGEEALISHGRRNATVTMKTDGRLLRLAKHHFDALLREPLLNELTLEEARRRVAAGAQWLDVRFPSEYQHDKIPGAINIPLSELRHALSVLDRKNQYIAYCQSGRRSAAAAFLLAQRGFSANVLAGGLWGAQNSADK
jgi:rhodanese-related sulfurtransferase